MMKRPSTCCRAIFMRCARPTCNSVQSYKEYIEKNYASLLPPCVIVVHHTLFTIYAYKNIKKNIHAHPTTICFHLSIIRWKVSKLETLADLLETIFVDLGAINHES